MMTPFHIVSEAGKEAMGMIKPRLGVRVMFIGNSIQYYNDCLRFVANLCLHLIAHQDWYLCGGANLLEIWDGVAHGAPHWTLM